MNIIPYKDIYDPTLLQAVPREPHRRELGIEGALPFTGVDIWTAYELSWLDISGKPRVAMAAFVVDARSPNLIESKSFKVYLNSFNQTALASPESLRQRLLEDIGHACGMPVDVEIRLPGEFDDERIEELDGELLDEIDVEVRDYRPNPALLRTKGPPVDETLVSNLLKTNCPLTGQPDFAHFEIRYVPDLLCVELKSLKLYLWSYRDEGAFHEDVTNRVLNDLGPRIDRAGLLRYLVSFRQHGGFHEQCVENIFTDILGRCAPERLTVYARYTRRGGLDINPFRTNSGERPPRNVRTARQ